MTENRTEWAAQITYYSGEVKYSPADDRGHAELIADSIATHLSTLNDPTRRENGVDAVALVSRLVIVEDDGTQIIKPWQVERAGEPLFEGEGVE